MGVLGLGARPKNSAIAKQLLLPPPTITLNKNRNENVNNLNILLQSEVNLNHSINKMDKQSSRKTTGKHTQSKVNSVVIKPDMQTIDKHDDEQYVIDSDTSDEGLLVRLFKNQQIECLNSTRHRSRSLDLDYQQEQMQFKVNDWLEKEKTQDGMNQYFKHAKPFRDPHLDIPKARSFERNEREQQQKRVQQLANSDEL